MHRLLCCGLFIALLAGFLGCGKEEKASKGPVDLQKLKKRLPPVPGGDADFAEPKPDDAEKKS